MEVTSTRSPASLGEFILEPYVRSDVRNVSSTLRAVSIAARTSCR